MKLTKEVENFIKEYDIELIEFKSKKLKAKFLCKKCGGIYEKSLEVHYKITPCIVCRPKDWVNPRTRFSEKGRGMIYPEKRCDLHSILEGFKPKLEKKFDGFTEVYDYLNYEVIKENFDYICSLPTQELNKLVEGFDFDFWKGHKIK